LTIGGGFFCWFFLLCPSLYGQNKDAPYSRFGIGELYPESFINQWSLGGAGLAHRSPTNFSVENPASISPLKQTVFEFGVFNLSRFTETGEEYFENAEQNLSYFSLGFPIDDKRGIAGAFSLRPLSDIDYILRFDSETRFPEGTPTTIERFEASGGLNEFGFQLGARLDSNWSIGLNPAYVWGDAELSHNQLLNLSDSTVSRYQVSEREDLDYQGFRLKLGLQHVRRWGKNRHLSFGLAYTPSFGITEDRRSEALVNVGSVADTILRENTKRSIELLPTALGLGLQYQWREGRRVSLDLHWDGWSAVEEAPFSEKLQDRWRLQAGYALTPNPEALQAYFQRVSYHFGGRFERSYVEIDGTPIHEAALSFGMVLPLNQNASTINLGVEIAQKGETTGELLRERLLRLQLGLSLNDRWFQTRKIN
jgi:hypothetical protein